MNATTMEENPYSAPDAELGQQTSETYSPSIFTAKGRIGRLRYLAYSYGVTFLLMLVMMPLAGASAFLGGGAEGGSMLVVAVTTIAYIAMIVLCVMFAKRRFNDLDRSGWWCLLFLVPIVNILASIYLMFFPGSEGSNNFGPAPEANSMGVKILGLAVPILFFVGIAAALVIPMMAA